MTRNRTSWQPGQSGNPKGRVPKNRALTALLEKTGAQKDEGQQASHKTRVAQMLWRALTTGRLVVEPPDGGPRTLTLNYQEWLDTVRFVYNQIDGPPKTQTEISGPDGGPVEVVDYSKLSTQQIIDLLAALERDGAEAGTGAATAE